MTISENLLKLLQQVNQLHRLLAADPFLTRQVRELQRWQNRRTALTYQDFRHQPEYLCTVDFMVNDLHGGESVSQRDAQMERAYSALVKFLPDNILVTVVTAMELSLLSNTLDQSLAKLIVANYHDKNLDEAIYAKAISNSNSFDLRLKQIALTKQVGEELARIVKMPFISVTLKMCRTPASLAGLHELQDYLERGFHAFKTMKNPDVFLNALEQRETEYLQKIFKRK